MPKLTRGILEAIVENFKGDFEPLSFECEEFTVVVLNRPKRLHFNLGLYWLSIVADEELERGMLRVSYFDGLSRRDRLCKYAQILPILEDMLRFKKEEEIRWKV